MTLFYKTSTNKLLRCRTSGKMSSKCACQPMPEPYVWPETIGGSVFVGMTAIDYECLNVDNVGDDGSLLSWGTRFVSDDDELNDAVFFDPGTATEGELIKGDPYQVCAPYVGIDPQYFSTPGLHVGQVEIYERVLPGIPSSFADVEISVAPNYTGALEMFYEFGWYPGYPNNTVRPATYLGTDDAGTRTWRAQILSPTRNIYFYVRLDGNHTIYQPHACGDQTNAVAVTFDMTTGAPTSAALPGIEYFMTPVCTYEHCRITFRPVTP